MFKAMNKYYEINFDKIVEVQEMIANENIEITCVNPLGISIIVPGASVNILIDEKENVLLKDVKYYISSFSSKFFNLNNMQIDQGIVVENSDDNESDYFYRIYKNCTASNNNLKAANSVLFNNIINEKPNNRLYVLKPYFDELKLESKSSKATNGVAASIERLLTGLGIIARLDFIRYLRYMKTSGKASNSIITSEYETMIFNMISSIVIYLEKEYVSYDIFDSLDLLDDSNILSHGNRVFIFMVEFLYYYNNTFNKGLSNKLRQDYRDKYWNMYKDICNKFNISKSIEILEKVYKLGIRKFTSSEIISYAVGAFYHDSSMLNIMDFIPTDEFIKDGDFKDFHTHKSYYFLKYILHQKEEACLVAGLHHECYGYGSGMMKKFVDKKIHDPKHKINFLISFEAEDIINVDALNYFPAKMLEVVDIYDTLTFMYGTRNKNPEEILMFMKTTFIDEKIKIDPVVFDLFIQFLKDTKGINFVQEE